MSYQVFARKYRPRTFDDVLGQDHVVRTLRNAIAQNRLAHAYLFVGPRGTGKTSTARIFAKALNCPGGPKVDFDPDDEVCVEIEKGICLDVREIDGASNNGVEQVRELREEVKFAPTRCRYKIYYIDEVHMLSTAAFNALLKTLEEPPEHVKFIFATTEAHKVLPTIISRCQRFDLRRIPTSVIANHLMHIASQEGVGLDPKAAFAIAKGAEGGMRDAQSMLDQLVAFCGDKIVEQDVLDIFGFTQGETVAHLAHAVLQQDTVSALQQLHSQADGGKDLSRLLADLIQHFRNLLVHQVDPGAVEEELSPELVQMVRAQSSAVDADSVLRVMDGLAEVDARMRWASNKLLHMEIALIQAVQTLGEVTLNEVLNALGGGEVPQRAITRRAIAPLSPSPTPPVVTAKPVETPAPVTPMPVTPQPVAESPKPVAEVSEPVRQVPASVPVNREPSPRADVTSQGIDQSQSSSLDLPTEDSAPAVVPASATDGEISLEELWQQFLSRVRNDRPLASGWLDYGTFLRKEDKTMVIGLPVTEDAGRDQLLRPAQRKWLEATLSEIVGKPTLIDIVLDDSLTPPPASEMMLGGLLDASEPAPPPSAAASAPAPSLPAENANAPAEQAKETPPKIAMDPEFYNDPLIKDAIERFKATLVN